MSKLRVEKMTQQRIYRKRRGSFCICPRCGAKKIHRKGIPCQMEKCPICGSKMIRENFYQHKLLKKCRNKKNFWR
jgi:hypothetical protein